MPTSEATSQYPAPSGAAAMLPCVPRDQGVARARVVDGAAGEGGAPPPVPGPGSTMKTMCLAVAADACEMGSAVTEAMVTNAARPTATRRSERLFVDSLPQWVQAGT